LVTATEDIEEGPGVAEQMTIYSTPWCGYCHRLMKQLDREGLAYATVDIEQDPAAADYVMSVNGGNQTVPTVVFADGSALTNPSLAQVKDKLAA
jgi:mycoredoxin